MRYKQINGKILCYADNDIIMYSPDTYKYLEDEAVPWVETEREIVRLSDYSFVFDDDPRIIEVYKLQKLNELETSFDTRVSGAFTCSQGWPMQFNRSDTLAVEGAIQLLKSQNEHTGYLTDANDETHYGVPLETMEAVKLEMLQAYARCHAHKQELRKIINDAQSKEELAEITISWPV